MRIRRLRVVDPAHSVALRDRLGAMVIDVEGPQSRADFGRPDPEGSRDRRCRQHIRDHVGRPEADAFQFVDGGEFDRSALAIIEEGTIDHDSIDKAEVARTGDSQAEADGAATLDHVGLFDHLARRVVLEVVDAGDLRIPVDLRLGCAIGLVGTVPIEVILRDVQAGGRPCGHAVQVVQLETRELDDECVEADWIADGVEHRDADIAAGDHAPAARSDHCGRELHGGGLAVRSGYRQPLGGRTTLVAEAPGEFDVTPDRQISRSRPEHERMTRSEAGRHDDELRRKAGQLRLEIVEHESYTDHIEKVGGLVVGAVRKHEQLRAELRKGVRHGETRDAEPEHRDLQAGPVRVPTAQLRDGFRTSHPRTRETHSR